MRREVACYSPPVCLKRIIPHKGKYTGGCDGCHHGRSVGGHCHDGTNSSAIDHNELSDNGILTHLQIDQMISSLPSHANSEILHSTPNERLSWNDTAQEVINARTSSVYGQYSLLDTRLEFIETSVAPDAHDQMTDRHTTATGSGDNQSRHKATAIWDETRNQTLQESLDDIESGVVSDDSFVKSGIATVDGVATQQSFRDRNNWLLRNLPENQLWNGSFSYQGIQNTNSPTFRPVAVVALSLSTGIFKNGIPGWVFETPDEKSTLLCTIWTGDEKYFMKSTINNKYKILYPTSQLPINSLTNFHSYPMILKNNTLYTFNCYHFFPLANEETSTFNVKIQYSQSDGTWIDIASVNFTTEPGKIKHSSYAFTSHNYTGIKHGYHRIMLTLIATTNQEYFRLGIHEMGVYEGNLESNYHKVLTNRECANLSLGKRYPHQYVAFSTKCFAKSLLQRVNIENDEELETYEFQIPKTGYVNRFEVSTSYNQIIDIGKQKALEAPALTSSDLTANTSG